MMTSAVQEKVEHFFAQFEHKHFKKGETIMYPDETGSHAYFIKSGFVKNFTLTPDGVELTLHIFAAHSYFPMMSIISDLQNRYYYEALSDTSLYMAPKHEVLTFLKSNPDILMELSGRLLNGLDKLTMRIEYLALQSANKRVVSTLIFLSNHFGEKRGDLVFLTQSFTHRDIASFAGLSRETTSREWEKLQKDGLVSMEKQHITLHDIARLTALGSL